MAERVLNGASHGAARSRRALPIAGEAGRAERKDAAENRRQILEAARRLVALRGVDAVCMDEIAREAGVGKGTLYRRYAHKGELCAALLDDNARAFQADVLAQLRAERTPALAQLTFFLERLVAFSEENAALLGAVSDAASGRRRDAYYRSAPYEWQRAVVAAILHRAVQSGECPALDVDYLADAILAPLDIDLYSFQRHARGLSRERIVAGLTRLIQGGIRGDGVRRRDTET